MPFHEKINMYIFFNVLNWNCSEERERLELDQSQNQVLSCGWISKSPDPWRGSYEEWRMTEGRSHSHLSRCLTSRTFPLSWEEKRRPEPRKRRTGLLTEAAQGWEQKAWVRKDAGRKPNCSHQGALGSSLGLSILDIYFPAKKWWWV